MNDDKDKTLMSKENLNRASPELWPEQIPGVTEFLSSKQSDFHLRTPEKYSTELDKDDLEMIHDFGSLSIQQVMEKIKHLQNLAYQLSVEEAREMSRGKLLNIIEKRD